jgi:hypothetical protein
MKNRFLQGAILRFVLCLCVLLTPLALLHAQDTFTAGTPFNVVNENSGLCIGASGQGTANGTAVQMYTCANGTYSSQLSQEWIFTAGSSGYYEVSDANATGETWNVTGNGTTNGSLIQLWTYAGNSNEEFEPVSLGSGYYKFVGQGSGLCLDVPGNSTANSVQLEIYTCNGTTAQAFKLVTPSAATCASVPSAPTGLAASGTTSSSTNLSWTAATVASGCSVTSYTVYENGSALATVTGTSYAVSGLAASTTYSYTVAATDSDGASAKSSAVSVTTPASGTGEGPYGGTAAAIPGTVMAENYDTGGQGVGYNVTSTNGTDNGYRSDGVDLETATAPATGNDLGWTASGQWFRYTVKVSTAGTYTVSFLVAAESAVSDAFHLSNSSGTNLSGSVAVPDTGGWQTWTTVTATVTLPAGQQTLTLNQDNGGWNIDSMAFASGSGGGTPTGDIFAPYEYVGDLGDANQIPGIVEASGAKAVILAFLDPDNNGCSLIWPGANGALPNDTVGSTSMGTAISQMQADGITVIISQGGAGGQEAAAYCGTAAETQAVYQQLITLYHVKWLDFDVEYGETSGQPTRRAQALAALQAANPGLIVSYTLPLGPGGLDSGTGGGTTDLTDAKSAGLNLNIVNGMAMDFGGTNENQPALAEEGAAGLQSQIQSAGLTSTVGLTFLPGTSDDSPPNYFTLANATTMVNFAKANSYITLLSFWELNRDNGGCPGSTVDEDNCSGVSQSNYQFSSIFEAF